MRKFLSVVVSVALVASMCACAPKEDASTPEVSVSVSENVEDNTTSVEDVVDASVEDDNNEEADVAEENTLESLYANEEIKAEMEKSLADVVAENSEVYSNITFEAKGNDVYYNYYYAEGVEVDVDVLKAQDWDTILKDSLSAFDALEGYTAESDTFTYYTFEGEELFTVSSKNN